MFVMIIIGMIVMAIIGGSYRTEIKYAPSIPGKVVNVVPFEESLDANHWLGGMVKGEQADLQGAIDKHLGKGKCLVSLEVVTKHRAMNWLVTVFTLAIYSPVTVEVKGTVGDVVVEPQK